MIDEHGTATDAGELPPQLVQTIEHLTARWARADTAILKHVFPLLGEGQPVSLNRLAESSGTTTDIAAQAVTSGRITLDDNGDIIELFGVTLTSTGRHIHAKGVSLYSCCALVAHVVPRLLDRTVSVRSQDPVTGEQVELEIAPNGVRRFQPNTAVASMIVTDDRTIQEDAPVHFCQHVHHCASRESAVQFVANVPGRYVLTIRNIDIVAQHVCSAIWS